MIVYCLLSAELFRVNVYTCLRVSADFNLLVGFSCIQFSARSCSASTTTAVANTAKPTLWKYRMWIPTGNASAALSLPISRSSNLWSWSLRASVQRNCKITVRGVVMGSTDTARARPIGNFQALTKDPDLETWCEQGAKKVGEGGTERKMRSGICLEYWRGGGMKRDWGGVSWGWKWKR